MVSMGPLATSPSGTQRFRSCDTAETDAEFPLAPEVNRLTSDEGARRDQGQRYVPQYTWCAFRPRVLSRQAYAALEGPHGRRLQDLHSGQGHRGWSPRRSRDLCRDVSYLLR